MFISAIINSINQQRQEAMQREQLDQARKQQEEQNKQFQKMYDDLQKKQEAEHKEVMEFLKSTSNSEKANGQSAADSNGACADRPATPRGTHGHGHHGHLAGQCEADHSNGGRNAEGAWSGKPRLAFS